MNIFCSSISANLKCAKVKSSTQLQLRFEPSQFGLQSLQSLNQMPSSENHQSNNELLKQTCYNFTCSTKAGYKLIYLTLIFEFLLVLHLLIISYSLTYHMAKPAKFFSQNISTDMVILFSGIRQFWTHHGTSKSGSTSL